VKFLGQHADFGCTNVFYKYLIGKCYQMSIDTTWHHIIGFGRAKLFRVTVLTKPSNFTRRMVDGAQDHITIFNVDAYQWC
jgi:hypothetical protein